MIFGFDASRCRSASRENDWLRLTRDDRAKSEFDWSVAMRKVLLAAVMFGAVSAAHAADLPDLPILRGGFTEGVPSRVNWQGFYVGGQAGYGSSDENFNGSTRTMMEALLANTVIEDEMQVSQWNLGLGKQSSRTSAFGAFAGYNAQWEDVVLGLEASYMHGTFGGTASATEARSSPAPLSDTYFHDVTANSSASISISDMATFRGRAGYAWGCFLPYVFGGFALGNADTSRSVSVTDVWTPGPSSAGPGGAATLSNSEALHNHLIYGYTAGLGVDVNLIGGLFLRAEWEYVRFTSTVDTNINTVRAGLGYKF
jgi:outer membrane immunogenic protein